MKTEIIEESFVEQDVKVWDREDLWEDTVNFDYESQVDPNYLQTPDDVPMDDWIDKKPIIHLEPVKQEVDYPETRNFQCPYCDLGFLVESEFKKHKKSFHSNLKNNQCQFCEFNSIAEHTLRIHIESVHFCVEDYKCHLCDFVTVKAKSMQIHIQNKHMRKLRQYCDICDFSSNSKQDVFEHKKKEHAKEKKEHCEHCDFKCSSKYYLKNHVRNSHDKPRKSFDCKLCDFKSFHLKSFTEHKQEHKKKGGKVEQFKCNKCNHVANTAIRLLFHKQWVHNKKSCYDFKKITSNLSMNKAKSSTSNKMVK